MEALLKRIWNTDNLTLNTAPKWKDMRISYIPINLDDMRNIAYILKFIRNQEIKVIKTNYETQG